MIIPKLSFKEGDAPDQADTTAGAQVALTCPSVKWPGQRIWQVGSWQKGGLTMVSPFSTARVTIYKESDYKCQAIELMNSLHKLGNTR